ncbi:MAG: twin-arginine translocation signal domain-containing protein [Pseudomonadota bacterium]
MTQHTGINRRHFMAGSAVAATAVTATPGAAGIDSSTAQPIVTDWARLGPQDMTAFIGHRFRVTAPDGRSGILELIDAEPIPSGPDRPANLPRGEGVVAVFDSPDKDLFLDAEAKMHRVSHPILGSADLLIARSPKRSGGDVIELVLN